MFVYGGNGETDGPARISNKEFCKKIANEYTALLSTYTADGQVLPRGSAVAARWHAGGDLHFRTKAPAATTWSARATGKSRCSSRRAISAGDAEPGAGLLEFVEPLIYQSSLDFRAVEAVSETRQRISEKAAARNAAGRRAGYQADSRRHPRYRVSGAMPAAPARRPRALGAARRHHVRALPPARQAIPLRCRNTRGWRRRTSSCATWSTGCKWTKTGRLTPCPGRPANSTCWRARCRPKATATALDGAIVPAAAGRASGRRAGDLRSRDPRAEAAVLFARCRCRTWWKTWNRRRRPAI